MEEWKEYRIGEIAQTNVSQYSLSENWEIIHLWNYIRNTYQT